MRDDSTGPAIPSTATSPHPRKTRSRPIRTEPLSVVVDRAVGEIAMLAEEMEEWRGNIEEHFSSTQKYYEVEEAAQALETLHDSAGEAQADIAKAIETKLIEDQAIESPILRGRAGRWRRAAHAAQWLEAVADKIGDKSKPIAEALRDVASELENIDFPGMF